MQPTTSIGNRYMQRHFDLSGNVLRTTAIVNHITGHRFEAGGDEFLIELDGPTAGRSDLQFARNFDTLIAAKPQGTCLTSGDFLVEGHELGEGGERLTVNLRHEDRGLQVQVRYELGADDHFMRKWLHVAAIGSSHAPLVTRVEVERLTFVPPVTFDQPRVVPHPQGLGDTWYGEPALGQPLLADELFCGLEHPAGYNRCEQGTVLLRHFPGRRIDQPLVSKPAVSGVSQRGQVCAAFRDYLMTVATPHVRDRKPIVGHSNWAHTNTGPNQRRMLDLADLVLKKLSDENGLALDYFEIDCGWADTDTLWEHDPVKFPNGFAPLVERLKKHGTRLGLWYSPTGFWGLHPDAKHGYEMIEAGQGFRGGYCPAGPKHHEALTKVMTQYIREYDMKIVIFDFFSGYCQSGDHGHLAGRPYSLEAIYDTHFELIAALRRAKPDLYVVDWETSLYGYSPWLVMHVDTAWMGWSDSPNATGMPSPLPQATWNITARDDMTFTEARQLEGHGRLRPSPYPSWATDRFAFWDMHEPILEQGMPVYYGHRSDNAMMGLSRGGLFWNMWTIAEMFTDSDWAFVASAFKWALDNVAVLGEMRPLFGEPIKRKVYAYGNFADGKGIVTMRNPFVTRQRAEVALDESLGIAPDDAGEYVARVIYPYHGYLPGIYRAGSVVAVDVPGYQAITIELVNREKLPGPVALGARYTSDGSAAVLHGEAGTAAYVDVVGPQGEVQEQRVEFEGKYEGLAVDVARALQQGDGLLGLINMTIPAHYRDNMLLVLFESETPEQIFCRIDHYDELDGSITKPITQRSARDFTFGGNPHNMIHESHWVYFLCPLATGRHQLHVQVQCVEHNRFARGQWAQPLRGYFSMWLWTRVPLAAAPLPSAGPVADRPIPLALTQDVDQRLVQLIAPMYINTKALVDRFQLISC